MNTAEHQNIKIVETRSIREHVVRVLMHLQDVDMNRFDSVAQYVREVSRFVRDQYSLNTTEMVPLPATPVTIVPKPRAPYSRSLFLQDFESDNQLLSMVGHGFDEVHAAEIQICMQALAESLDRTEARRLRFWGGISLHNVSYHVFQVTSSECMRFYATTDLSSACIQVNEDCTSILEVLREIASDTDIAPLGEYLTPSIINPEFSMNKLEANKLGSWRKAESNCLQGGELGPADDVGQISKEHFDLRTVSGLTLIENRKWPGAITVCNGKRYVRIYNGWK
jgi:hypothetical protein